MRLTKMKQIYLITATLLLGSVTEAVLPRAVIAQISRTAHNGFIAAEGIHRGDMDWAGFEADVPGLLRVLQIPRLSEEGYKERLSRSFKRYKTHEALRAAGHVGADHKASVEALMKERDDRRGERDALHARVQVAPGGIDSVHAGGHLYTHARHTVDMAASRTAGEGTERALWEGRLQGHAHGDDTTQIYSKTKYDRDIAAVSATEHAAGQQAKLTQVMGELGTLKTYVTAQKAGGHITPVVEGNILAQIGTIEGNIA